MQFTVPRLIKDKHQHFSILFYAQGKRYRVSNGKKFGVDLHPNKEPFDRRLIVAQELQLRIHQALHDGWGQQPTTEMTFQQAMGHASLAVSLGYLRNLEVPMLKVEDMPSL